MNGVAVLTAGKDEGISAIYIGKCATTLATTLNTLALGEENGVASNGRKISLEISPLLTISLRMPFSNSDASVAEFGRSRSPS